MDESTSAMRFWTTHKCDLPHYSCIFRKVEPLGMEMKNVVCSRIGDMLYLNIQKGKEATKTAELKQQIGGTAARMKILIMDTKG